MSKFTQFLKLAMLSGCSIGFIIALLKINKLKKIRKILKNKKMPNIHEVKTICESITGNKMTSQDIQKLQDKIEFVPSSLDQNKSFNYKIITANKNSNLGSEKDLSQNIFELDVDKNNSK